MERDCCEPGDVTITQTTGGYRLSRVLPGDAAFGPWWELVKIVPTREEAIRVANALTGTGRAWFRHEGDVYELVSMDDSPAADTAIGDAASAS